MTTIDERVAYLEGKVEEHSRGFGELRDAVRQLDGKVDRLFGHLDARITGLDTKMDQGFARLDEKMSRQFLWILGVQIAVLISVIGALAAG